MSIAFNEVAATQAASHLLRSAGGQMSSTKLIRLLYLADRAAILKHGAPITGDTYTMSTRGPVLVNVLDKISNATSSFWSDHIAPDPLSNNEVGMFRDPDDDALSEDQIEILTNVFEEYRSANLGHMLAALPECRGRQGTVTIEDILRTRKK